MMSETLGLLTFRSRLAALTCWITDNTPEMAMFFLSVDGMPTQQPSDTTLGHGLFMLLLSLSLTLTHYLAVSSP